MGRGPPQAQFVTYELPESRVLGHAILSPPIGLNVGKEGCTEDWAVIAIDASKIDRTNFIGNAIDLGTHIPADTLKRMMYPDIRNPASFKYLDDRLLRLKGTITKSEMRHPTAIDHAGEPCLMVMKRGKATGLTVGRANGIRPYTRYYSNITGTSTEWAILPLDSDSGPFSDKGDSGAVIVDGLGRIGGLLTAGAGITDSTDITYASPIGFLLECRPMQNTQ